MHQSHLSSTITVIQLMILSTPNTAESLPTINVSLVVIGQSSVNGFSSLPYEGPAISLAVAHAQEKYAGVLRFKTHYIHNASCVDLNGNLVGEVSKWYYQQRDPKDINIFIDTANICAGQNELSYFQKQWDILVITTAAANLQVYDQGASPAWLFTSYFHLYGMSALYVDVVNIYNWTSLFIIIDTLSPPTYFSMSTWFITDLSRQGTFTPVVRRIAAQPGVPFGNFRAILEEAQKVSRIILYFGYGAPLREFLVTAFLMNMTNGEYVYMVAENQVLRPMHWQHNDADDQAALRAFQSVLLLDLHDSTNASSRFKLGQEFRKGSAQEYRFEYNLTDQPYLLILANYISVTALAQVVNETLSSCDHSYCRSGSALARNFMNRTFRLDGYGDSMYIDSVGVRRTNFTVSHFDENGHRQPFLELDGKSGAVVQLATLTSWGGASFPPPNEPLCGYQHLRMSCLPRNGNSFSFVTAFTSVATCCIIAALCLTYVYLKKVPASGTDVIYRRRKEKDFWLYDKWWQIHLAETCAKRSQPSTDEGHFAELQSQTSDNRIHFAEYNGMRVTCSRLCVREHIATFDEMAFNWQLLVLLRKIREMEHLNLCQFYGMALTQPTMETWWISAVTEYPSRDMLPNMFESFIATDAVLTTSLVVDYLDALEYVHSSQLQYHGRLSILSCRIDRHFTLKVADLAFHELQKELSVIWKDIKQCNSAPSWERLYRAVPEQFIEMDAGAVRAVDVWSSALIIFDILTKGKLYLKLRSTGTGDTEPYPSYITHQYLHQLFERSRKTRTLNVVVLCLNADPNQRPTVHQIRQLFVKDGSDSSGKRHPALIDRIYQRISSYSVNLESQVADRKAALRKEIRKCEDIVQQFLPRAIVRQLREGMSVVPEYFDCVTLMFTDLSEFSDFVKFSQPEDIISLLGQIEAGIDDLSEQYDVYKVEAVGDSYLVASGLPVRIGNTHVERVANFALELIIAESRLINTQSTVYSLQSTVHCGSELECIPVKVFSTSGSDTFNALVGYLTGACAAGIMGTKRPRYCLFGDTVNTASRMCSHGLPGRIHLSAESQFLLEQFPQFAVEPRGWLAIKGKCDMKTFWLAGLRK